MLRVISGRSLLALARARPDTLVIGVDANAAGMAAGQARPVTKLIFRSRRTGS